MKLIDVLKLIDDLAIVFLYSRRFDPETKEDMDILLAYCSKIEIKKYEKYLNALVLDASYFQNKDNACYILIKGDK